VEITTQVERKPGPVFRHQAEKEIIRTRHYQVHSLALHSMSQIEGLHRSLDEAAHLNHRGAGQQGTNNLLQVLQGLKGVHHPGAQ
jgi:hypothetical protein